MNNRILLGLGICAAISVGVVALIETKPETAPVETSATELTLAIDDVSKIKSGDVKTAYGNDVNFFTNDFSAEGVLNNGGFLYNTTIIHGISQVSVTASSQVKILGGWWQTGTDSIGWDLDHPFATGSGNVVANLSDARPDYFAIVADGANATLSNLSIQYDCAETLHTFTTYFYSTNQPNSLNKCYMIIDSNYKTNNQWINHNNWETNPMTYVGRAGDYYKYSYTTALPYGLVRFQFIANDNSSGVLTVGRYSDWKPHGFYLNNDTTLYCYCDDGFPAAGGNNTFEVYDHELSLPYKTTVNLTFEEGSTDDISYVGIKARTGSNNYAYKGALTNTDGVWSWTYNSGEDQEYDFFIEAYADSWGKNSELWKNGDSQTGFHITVTSGENTAIVNINAGVVNAQSTKLTATVTSSSGCVIA